MHAQEDGRKEETEKLYNVLQKEVDKSNETDHLFNSSR